MDLIVDLEDLGRYTHIGFKDASEAIVGGIEMIITPHILLVNSAMSRNYNVYVTNGDENIDINKIVTKEGRMPHDLIIEGAISSELDIDINSVLTIDYLSPKYFNIEMTRFNNTINNIVDKLSLLISHYYLSSNDILDFEKYKDDEFILSLEKLCLYDLDSLRFGFINNDELTVSISHMVNKYDSVEIPVRIISMTSNDIKLYAKDLYRNNIIMREREVELKNKAVYKKEYKEYLKLKERFEGDNYE